MAGSAGALMLEGLRKGLRNYRECTFPGLSAMAMLVCPLSVDELQASHAAAEKRFRELEIGITVLTADDFAGELHIQVLARALRDPADPGRRRALFADADELRAAITADERTLLVDEYVEVQSLANPAPEAVSDVLFEQIETAIKKKDQGTLRSIGSRTLSLYLLSLDNPPPI